MRATMLLFFAALASCSDGKDAIAERVEDRADNRAEAMERAGESMTNTQQRNIVEEQAKDVREAGEERAEAIRESDLNARDLSNAQKNELIRGE